MRLLSWNVQWCRGLDGRVDPARIAAEARRLADPDVICFQEIAAGFAELPGSGGEDQVEALRSEFPRFTVVSAWAVDLPGERSARSRFGNLILSRLPLRRVLRHSLPWPAAPDSPSMPRVALEAEIESPFGPLRVVTTHLEYYSAAHRRAQVERLRELHAEACAHARPAPGGGYGPLDFLPRPAPAILCGDLNFAPQDSLHRGLLEAGFVDAWQALNPGRAHAPTFRVYEPEKAERPYCCDYVFVSTDLSARLRAIRVDAAVQASDHQPVMVELA
jgi:endonuclease/exonuclease/phosphatase family metal-dependent hydrolase